MQFALHHLCLFLSLQRPIGQLAKDRRKGGVMLWQKLRREESMQISTITPLGENLIKSRRAQWVAYRLYLVLRSLADKA